MTDPAEVPDGGRGRARGTVALDNAGTLSDLCIAERPIDGVDGLDAPVPTIEDRRIALANLATDAYGPFDVDGSLARVIDRDDIQLRPVLGSHPIRDPDPRAVREAVLADRSAPARSVHAGVERTRERAASEHPHADPRPGIAVQLVVDIDAARVRSVIGYAPVPRAEAGPSVDRLVAAGFRPHIVSGDTDHVLRGVASALGLRPDRVHGDRSPAAKARCVERFRADGDGPVAMVGDYVNDRAAFEAADLAVLIDDGTVEGGLPGSLRTAADVVVSSLSGAVRTVEARLA